MDRVFDLFPRLKEREKQKAGTMSGGEQQMLAIGRALMGRPKLLLLDEPSMGIAPILVERIYETVVEINRQGTTILLVEQNANYAPRGLAARLRARDRPRRAHRRVGGAAREPGRPGGLPRRRRMTFVFALLGAKALWLTYIWLLERDRRLLALRPQGLRREAGAGDRAAAQRARRRSSGCSSPRKADSRWKRYGPFGRRPKSGGD